jgi:hypothetical protein
MQEGKDFRGGVLDFLGRRGQSQQGGRRGASYVDRD